MSLVKQTVLTLAVLFLGVCAWVYFFPGALQTLSRYNLDITPLPQIAAFGGRAEPANGSTGGAPGMRQREVLVITEPVTTGVINDRLTAIGNGRAVQSVTITPLVSGQIVDLPAVSGERVERGTVIAKLDAASETLALDKANLVSDDLRAKVARFESLLSRGSITSVEVENARSELSTAELAVREAELDLERRTITSPIAGVVGIVNASIGDYVTNQSTIVTVDDRSHIIIEYFVPERFATAVSIGAPVEAYSIARPGEIFSGTVTAIDNRVDVTSRTLRIRADINNDADKLRAGMAFQVTMKFDGETYPAVDPLAIQWDSNGSYVWSVNEEGKAMRKNARIVQRNAESVLVEAELQEGDLVVTEGVQNVRPGSSVKTAEDEDKTAAGKVGTGS